MIRALGPVLVLLAASSALASPDEPYLKNPRQLTSDSEFSKAGEAYFSPDGKQILFQAVKPAHPYYQIYVMDADGSGARMVSPGKGKMTCAYFHPDGKRFVYASTHLDERTYAAPEEPKDARRRYKWDYDGSFDLFVGDLATGKILSRLTEGEGYDAECSYSSDGKTICYTVRRGEKPDMLWLMDQDGKNKRALIDRPDLACGGPFFSPDNQWVLYRAMAPGGRTMHAYLTSIDGKTTKKLTTLPRVNWAPFFHPGGDVVAYAANMPDSRANFDVVLVKADGSGREVKLTSDKAFDGLPTFSPDGKHLMWTSKRGGKESQVYLAEFVMPPESAFKVPEPPAANPHGSPHGNPHANPHGPTSKPANPHGDPHQESPSSKPANPHGDPHQESPSSKPSDSHGSLKRSSGDGSGQASTGTVQPASKAERVTRPGLGTIVGSELLEDIAWLADDARGGRRSGTPGAEQAAEFIRERFEALGLEPGAPGGWFHTFEFSRGGRVAKSGNTLTVDGAAAKLERAFRPLLYSASASAEGRVAFVGYGIRSEEHDYDDFQGIELDGKVALVLTGAPRSDAGGAFGAKHPTVYQDLRYKVAACRDAGAVAVLLLRSKGEGWLELNTGNPGLPVAQLSAQGAKDLLGVDAQELSAAIDSHGTPASQVLAKTVSLAVKVERVRTQSKNVVGKIVGSEAPDEVIVIGAHYDHLGHGGEGSLSPKVEAVHNGADDNASGTAGVLALAKAFTQAPPRRSILFVAFGAEEEGLIGSKKLVDVLSMSNVVAMLNMDMIGRLEGKPVLLGGYGSAQEWPAVVQSAVDVLGAPVATQSDGFGPSDHASFYAEGVPVFFLWTGTHADYHKPSDDTDRVDVSGAEFCARLAYLLTCEVDARDERPTYVKVPRKARPKAVATGEKRAYFGSIPNYAQEGVTGVLLDGARAGTPAEAAGIQKGDVVVEFAGKTVTTIYDYVNALRLAKAGQTVTLVVERGGKRVTLEATLSAR